MTTAQEASFEPRMAAQKVSAKQYRAMIALETSVELEPMLRHLVKIRASQINGCAYCIWMHTGEARSDGEDEQRIYALSAWHESPLFTPRERAALALTESITLVGETHVPDDVFAGAREHFDDEDLAQLVWSIITINAWNRLAITMRSKPGS
jgi:AhpD family alkylhydroperoxidase